MKEIVKALLIHALLTITGLLLCSAIAYIFDFDEYEVMWSFPAFVLNSLAYVACGYYFYRNKSVAEKTYRASYAISLVLSLVIILVVLTGQVEYFRILFVINPIFSLFVLYHLQIDTIIFFHFIVALLLPPVFLNLGIMARQKCNYK